MLVMGIVALSVGLGFTFGPGIGWLAFGAVLLFMGVAAAT